MNPAGRLPADRRRGATHLAAPSGMAGLRSCPDRDACRRSRDARANAWPDMDTTRSWSHAPDGYRNRQSRSSHERMKPAPECCGTERSWRGLLGYLLLQAAVGRVRIIDHDLAHKIGRYPLRQHLVAIELPVRIVGRE